MKGMKGEEDRTGGEGIDGREGDGGYEEEEGVGDDGRRLDALALTLGPPLLPSLHLHHLLIFPYPLLIFYLSPE